MILHYFVFGPSAFAAVENAAQASAYAAAGWQRATRARFIAAWQQRDDAAYAELRKQAGLKTRAVGGWRKSGFFER